MSGKPHNGKPNGGGNNTKTTNISNRVDAQQLLDLYLSDRKTGMNGSTPRSHRSRLSFFVEWFQDETNYQYVDELDRTDILRFSDWRFDDHAPITVKTQMDTLRQLLRWGEKKGFLVEDIHVAAESPTTDDDDDVASDRYVEPEHVQDSLNYFKKYEWGQRQTVVLSIIWETAMRRSAVRALDIEDWHRPDDDGKGHITVRNRPSEGTRLKNGPDSERDVAVRAEIADIIDAWIDGPRPTVTDEHGREPLITTRHGRISDGCIQTDVYDALKPTRTGQRCSCKGNGCNANGKSDAYECEDSEGPHAVRKAAITYHLDNGWPLELISDRANCGAKTIDKHYDNADEHQQMQRREEFLDNL